MPERGVNYHCAKCGKPITEYDAQITPDGKLHIFGWCHGEEFEIILWLGIGGEVFGPLDSPPSDVLYPFSWADGTAHM